MQSSLEGCAYNPVLEWYGQEACWPLLGPFPWVRHSETALVWIFVTVVVRRGIGIVLASGDDRGEIGIPDVIGNRNDELRDVGQCDVTQHASCRELSFTSPRAKQEKSMRVADAQLGDRARVYLDLRPKPAES